MNTKYPLNGRVTTLADLVHEYGTYSGWVNNKYPELKTLNDNSAQPFQKLIFKDNLDSNNNFVAEIPYEVVYFDDIYSSTQKDNTGKHMKLIQQNDTSTFGIDTYGWLGPSSYVKAGIVTNTKKIKDGYFGFKFIGANIDKNSQKSNQFYYNYRTSQGEATVIYAFRNILQLLKDYNKVSDDDIKEFFNNNNILNSSAFFKNDKLEDLIDNNFQLKNDSYKYLGDAIWTSQYVQYENYVTKDDNYHPIIKKAKSLGYLKNIPVYNFKMLQTRINNFLKNKSDDKQYSFTNASLKNKLLYFFYIFLDSQRFFVSFVTSFRFMKMSNKSYLQSEPVLRCDLGMKALYKQVTIVSAVHDWHTALPQNAIQTTTKLNIILKYKVEYENIASIASSITTTIELTWADVVKYNKEDNNTIWFSLRNCVYDDPNTDSYKKFVNNKKLFGQYTYGAKGSPFLTIDQSSLKTLEWPCNEPLALTDEEEFNNIINNPTYSKNNIINYANTADLTTFNTSNQQATYKNVQDKIQNIYSPFGTLRMHNFLDSESANSEYYCDIDLYRCKNFYIIKSGETLSNITCKIYYSIPYNTILPNVYISTVNMSYDEAGTDENGDTSKDIPQNILTKYDNENKIKIYSIPNDQDKYVFITLTSSSAKQKLYASGEVADIQNTQKESYTNNLNIILYYFNNNKWQLAKEDIDYTISIDNNIKNVIPYYRFHINNTYNNYSFWKFKFDNIKEYVYFKTSNIQKNDKQSLFITTIRVADDNMATVEWRVRGQNNVNLSLQYLIYNDENTIEQYTQNTTSLNYFIQAFSDTHPYTNTNQGASMNKGKKFYIEPVSFNISDTYNYEEISGGEHSPFNVAYITDTTVNNKKIYKFIQCSTLFGNTLNDRRVLIDQLASQTQANIYLSLEPLYIFEFGTITYSKEKNDKDGKDNVESECSTKYNTMTFQCIKYKLNSGATEGYLKLDDNTLNIFSLYTTIIYFDCDILSKNSMSIIDDLNDITKEYLISYEIHIQYYNGTSYVDAENSPVTVSNGKTRDELNKSFKDIKIDKNKQYLVNIIFTFFRKRTAGIACTLGSSNNMFIGYIILKIIALPLDYSGDLDKNANPIKTITGSNTPFTLPIGCTVTIEDVYTYDSPDDVEWLGWKCQYWVGSKKSEEENHKLTFDIQSSPTNLSILSSVKVKNGNLNITLPQQPAGTTDNGNNTGGGDTNGNGGTTGN